MITNLFNFNDIENWIMCGDFNMVSASEEKQGDNPIDISITSRMNDTINSCYLKGMGIKETSLLRLTTNWMITLFKLDWTDS